MVPLLALFPAAAAAQTVDFEDVVPTNWTTLAPNLLTISPDRYKMGIRSLRWDWLAGGAVSITPPGINGADVRHPTLHTTCSFWVWNGVARPDGKLQVAFMAGGNVQYSFAFGLNFTGWRRAVRSFQNDMVKTDNASADFDSVRISAPASGSGTLFIDAVTWAGAKFDRIRDAQNKEIGGAESRTYYDRAYGQIPTTQAPQASQAELAELRLLRSRWLAGNKSRNAPTPSDVAEANARFNELGIEELEQGGTRGWVLTEDLSPLNPWILTLANHYHWTASETEAAACREKINKVARHLLDQGIAANSNVVPTRSPTPAYNFRDLPTALILMAAYASENPSSPRQPAAFDAETKAKLWDFLCWAYGTGDHWHTAWDRNMDDIYLHSVQQLGAILFLTLDDNEAVHQLKGHKAYLDRFFSPSPGGEGGIKVDGTGFHHNAHYNSYMYAYTSVASVAHQLRGTGFQISQDAYEHLRLGLLAIMNMSADGPSPIATRDDEFIGYFSNALSGRNPFGDGISFSRFALRNLAEAGGPFYGQSADESLAQAYNRRFGSSTRTRYAAFENYGTGQAPVGFFQYNYSPLGIYRRSTWVASIRAPNSYFWTSEIWTNENVYGRYQAYGSLDILYHGNVIKRTVNGKTITTKSGQSPDGWDWSQPPGTTTIALPHDKLGPKIREDVRSQLNFSGALAFHDRESGLYAAHFQEANTTASHNPTFTWRKSWFCFDNQIICLGSDISNNDSQHRTVTTLFQGVLVADNTPIILNDTPVTNASPHTTTIETSAGGAQNWLLDAYGTGFLVQSAETQALKLSRAQQSSAHQDGTSAPTTDRFAKAWIDHGTQPSGKGYEYAVFPATTAAAMAATAAAHANPATKPYKVLQRNGSAHIVKWNGTGQIGYALFTPGALSAEAQNSGLLISVQRPCLVMTRLEANGKAAISLVDPNLNFSLSRAGYGTPAHGVTRIHYGNTDASVARTINFTVRGTWVLENPAAETRIIQTTAATPAMPATTTIQVTTRDGLAEHVRLVGLSIWANLGTNWEDPANWGANWGGTPPANDPATTIAAFGTTTVQPVLNSAFAVNGLTLAGGTTLSGNGHLTLGSAGIVANGPGNTLSLANLSLHNAQTWAVGEGELPISSAIATHPDAHLTKAGPGTLILSGSNTFSSMLTIADGTVHLPAASIFITSRGIAFGASGEGTASGRLTLAGQSMLRLSADIPDFFNGPTQGAVLLSGGFLFDTAAHSSTVFHPLADLPGHAGGVTKTGAGTLVLAGTNTYTGTTVLAGGVLSTGFLANQGSPSGIGAAGPAASNLLIDGGTLKYTGPLLGGSGFWTRAFTIGNNSAAFDLSEATGQLRINGGIAFSGNGPRTLTITTGPQGGRLNSPLGDGSGGATSLVKDGPGTFLLTGANTYTGPLQILQGTVQYGFGNSGGGSSGPGHSVEVSVGATLSFRHAGTNTIAYDAPISGNGSVWMNHNNTSGGGSLTLGGVNTFTGGLSISPSSGTHVLPLRLGNSSALGSGHVTLGQYGALDLNGFSPTIGLLAGDGQVLNNGSAESTLTLGGTGTRTFSGPIANGTARLALTKTGAGTQLLAGVNTYTGATTVSQGHLELAATGQLRFRPEQDGAGTRITIASGASARFLGTFVLDLTAPGFTAGGSWQLVAAASTTTAYGPGFRILDFTASGATGSRSWTRPNGSRTWIFHESTGRLHLFSTAYATWLGRHPTLADLAADGDPDGDGITNLLEYVLGGDPASSDSSPIRPSISAFAATVQFTFPRNRASVDDTYLLLEYSSDLNSWTELVIGATSRGPDANGVSYSVEENGPESDLIIVTLPSGSDFRLFARLRAAPAH